MYPNLPNTTQNPVPQFASNMVNPSTQTTYQQGTNFIQPGNPTFQANAPMPQPATPYPFVNLTNQGAYRPTNISTNNTVPVNNNLQPNPTNTIPTQVRIAPQPNTIQEQAKPQAFTGNPNNASNAPKNLLDLLRSKHLLTQEDYEDGKKAIVGQGVTESQFIIGKKILDEDSILPYKSELYSYPYIDLGNTEVETEDIQRIPFDIAKAQEVVCVGKKFDNSNNELLKIAMADPLDIQKVRFLEAVLNKKVYPVYASLTRIHTLVETRYNKDVLIKQDVSNALKDVDSDILEIKEELVSEDSLSSNVNNAPIAKIVNMIVEYGVKYKSSDAHIEPRENKLSIRFRINGLLVEKLELPSQLANSIVARIKILSDLKIDEHRIPQDGRFEAKMKDARVDIRVSIMPTVYGEKVVMRFLDKTTGVFPLESTGLVRDQYKLYKEALSKTQGIILVTGPTGSGKTVTLSSSLGVLNKPAVNIVTLEDPVEIRVDGINQVQVNPEVGLTFASGLRAFLRQDPDIIMVGEIRDAETAGLATQAALVGRLVLATLHTNSAAGAIPRLLNMGIEPFLLASVINIIVAQRLPRKICEHCKTEQNATDEQTQLLKEAFTGFKDKNFLDKYINVEHIKLYKGAGCEKCDGSGYKGRIGIFEVLKVNENISKLIITQASAHQIEEKAIEENNFITMSQDGYMKALEGVTTVEEILRVQN